MSSRSTTKPRPVPRPPAKRLNPEEIQQATRLKVATDRDKALNPEELRVKLMTRHELNPKKYPHPGMIERSDTIWPEENKNLEGTKEEKLRDQKLREAINARCKYVKNLLTHYGWRIQAKYADHRIRIEGFHPEGFVCMVTFRMGKDGFRMNRYVLGNKEGDAWRQAEASALRMFIENPNRRVSAGSVQSRCTCDKTQHTTERAARKAVMRVKMYNLRKEGIGIGGHVYRCSEEDRVWHFTRQPRQKWREAPVNGLWKEPS